MASSFGLVPIDFHCMDKSFFSKYFLLCSQQQESESHIVLEQHEDE